MKRGFLNTPHAKRLIEEAYAPRPPPEPSRQPKTSSPPSSRRTQDGGAETAAVQDAMDVDHTADKDPVVDRAYHTEGCIVHEVLSNADKATPPSQAESRKDVNGTNAKAEQHPEGNDAEGKSEAKAVDMDCDHTKATMLHPLTSTIIPPRPPPGRQGWGRDPKEDFFHQVPPSFGGPDKKRTVFRIWPRDPNGKTIKQLTDQFRGTLSPDGYAWGATLYDLYCVDSVPEVPDAASIMTGSGLCEAMEELGELDTAATEIEWSKSEGKPRALGVANTEELIRCIDMRKQDNEQDDNRDEEDGGDEEDHGGEDGIPPPTIPVTSPFHPNRCPKPFVPFENPLSITLQECIPLYLLPQTLHIHDPFCLLPARERSFLDTSWTSRPDIIRTYNLELSGSTRRDIEEARTKAEELEEFKTRTLIILRYQRTNEQIKNYEPVIEVPLPPYQRRITKVKESHLYISPVAKVGEGHHSIVYKGEWELPREMFMKTRICSLCFKESLDKEIQRLKDTGRWKKLMRAASWGPKGFTGRQPTQEERDDVKEPYSDGEITEREVTCLVPPNITPAQVVEWLARDEKDVWNTLMKDGDAMHLQFAQDDADESAKDPHVAGIRINSASLYEAQKGCTHEKQNFPSPASVPRTTKFTVAAKLSLEYDTHLTREASNYQQFPDHFFRHYNGYTIINQLHTIVPVSAIVPQFYGYYVPKMDKEGDPDQPSYLSPILLLEHCGKPIEPDRLSIEDQEECASMLLRFQRAGWLHESIAPRNFLVQLGKPTEFPSVREAKPETSFRLIDFGRSRKHETEREKRREVMEVLRMFDTLHAKIPFAF